MIRLAKIKTYLIKKWKYILFISIFSLVTYFAFFLILWNFTLSGACDSFFINGALYIGVGILQIIANLGTFDLLTFSTSKFIDSYKKEKKYKEKFDVIDYKNMKSTKRNANKWNFVFYLIIGIFYLIGAIICNSLIYI